MDSGRANALKRKQELLSELHDIDVYLALDERFSGAKPEQDETPAPVKKPVKSLEAIRGKRKKKASPAVIAKVAAAVIREKDKPQTRGELVVALEEKGLTIISNDKPRYIGTILWRLSDQFVNLEGHGYWIKDQPYAPASYPKGGLFD